MKSRLLLSVCLCLASLPASGAEDAFVARPLFSPDRRPAPDQPALPSRSGRELPTGGWRLSGLVMGANGQTVILLTGSEGGPILRARPGDSVNGWLILDVQGHAIRLSRRGEMHSTGLRQALPE